MVSAIIVTKEAPSTTNKSNLTVRSTNVVGTFVITAKTWWDVQFPQAYFFPFPEEMESFWIRIEFTPFSLASQLAIRRLLLLTFIFIQLKSLGTITWPYGLLLASCIDIKTTSGRAQMINLLFGFLEFPQIGFTNFLLDKIPFNHSLNPRRRSDSVFLFKPSCI